MFDGLPEPIIKHIFEKTNKEIIREEGTVGCTELLYCPRKAFLRRICREVAELKPEQRWWIYRGNVFDELWASLFPLNQVEVRYKVNDKLTIVGHADFVYNDCVYELKTIKTLKYLKEPKEHHVKQVKFYAHCLGLEIAKIIYVSFEGFKIFDVDCSDSEEVVQELTEKALTFHEFWENCKLPPKTAEEWECKFCEVQRYCKEFENLDECCIFWLKGVEFGKPVVIHGRMFKTLKAHGDLCFCVNCGKILGDCQFCGRDFGFPRIMWFGDKVLDSFEPVGAIVLCEDCFNDLFELEGHKIKPKWIKESDSDDSNL
jgi:CRISPR/Cas system-associated exonuclease Cas4 (RecB family)